MSEEEIIYLELFSGYCGFRYVFEKAGWKFSKVYFSEIDKYAIANTRYNYPDAEYVGAVENIRDIGKVDLITFGWPCQDNSIAGKRKGQTADTRSGLLFHAINCVERFKPRNFVAENVEGLRTVNKGIDIIESLKILAFLNDSLPQYDIEMQLLNTRWFLPQNRERLFFIGHLRGESRGKVFPIGEDNSWIPEAASELSGKVHSEDSVANCLTKSMHKMARTDNLILSKVYKRSKSMAGRVYNPEGISTTINSQGGGQGAKTGLYEIEDKIRRLTPVECERLQGLPDNWTATGIFDGIEKPISDHQRYKLCGNGVSIPPTQAIAEKLLSLTSPTSKI